LKARTRDDYLAMIEPGKTAKDGRPFADGALYSIADRPLARITGTDVAALYRGLEPRGARQQTYAMQVLRAVLNWHGIHVPDNPLSRDVAGKDRLSLAKTTGDPTPIPPEKMAAWWAAATARAGQVSTDYYRVMLLTGARGGELKSVLMANVDVDGKRIVLRDTKNRSDHVLLLSTQAAAIVAHHAEGKKPNDPLFGIADPRKTLRAINEQAGVAITGHDLRATFASVAEELVSAYSLKRMLNHADTGDVTGAHYVGKSEAQLRAAWQTVADYIDPRPAPTGG
jgi:integrase